MRWLADDPEDAEERVTGQAMLHYQLASRGPTLADLQVQPPVLATFQRFLFAHAVRACTAEPVLDKSPLSDIDVARGRYRDQVGMSLCFSDGRGVGAHGGWLDAQGLFPLRPGDAG